jgi:uncharacterized protein YceH (UPF0502 family)
MAATLSFRAVEPDAVEIRVVAALVEKQRTTPDQYPLTLNSLRLACNQSTNRDPVVDYDEATIKSALERLGRRKWTTLASWSTARSVKYKHLFDQALGLSDPQLALMTVLMLRGAQTPGELRQRSERIHRFEDGDELDRTLSELIERDLATALPRQPGERGQRYAHRLSEAEEASEAAEASPAAPPPAPPGEPAPSAPGEAAEPPTPAAPAPPPAAAPAEPPAPVDDGLAARLERLEGEVAALREQLRALRAELGA